jgi:putative oxidoreductase
MKAFLNILNLGFLPSSADFGLLLLRIGTGIGMAYLHGWSKWVNVVDRKWVGTADFKAKWRDYIELGSPEVGYYLVVFAEVVCAILLAAGFLTRFAALVLGFAMGVALFVYHEGMLAGAKSGELAAMYGLACLTIFVAGPGKFSIDGAGAPAADEK